MINDHDSSAPKSPELTRLSGEQAEEREESEARVQQLRIVFARCKCGRLTFCLSSKKQCNVCWFQEYEERNRGRDTMACYRDRDELPTQSCTDEVSSGVE